MSNELNEIHEAFEALQIEHEDTLTQLEQIKSTQAGSDRMVGKLQEENRKLTEQLSAKTATDVSLVMERLQNLEKAYDNRVQALELEYYAKGKALESGVDYKLIADMNFTDEAAVDFKLEQLAEVIETAKQQEFTDRLNSTTKPKSGNLSSTVKAPPYAGLPAGIQKQMETFTSL